MKAYLVVLTSRKQSVVHSWHLDSAIAEQWKLCVLHGGKDDAMVVEIDDTQTMDLHNWLDDQLTKGNET